MAVGQAGLNIGATSWVLCCAALVFLMTPAVGFFYGGMVRSTNAVSLIVQSFATVGLVSLVWVGVGFSLAFGDGNPIIGGVGLAGLTDLNAGVPGVNLDGVPLLAFMLFQMMFAIITPALITGAGAERWRFGAFLFFTVGWSLLVYSPTAHWVFSPLGWAAKLGALDWAGGAVVHASAGAAALVVALRLGRRTGWPDPRMRPHSLPLVLLGAGLLWFGWFGFNGGTALTANGLAAIAVTNTHLAASTGMLTWALAERIRVGKATTLGAASGAVAGLVAITPAAGYVSPLGALAIGVIAGAVCQLLVGLKSVFGFDDALDVAAVHLGGGVVGSLAVGLFASSAVNPAGSNGLFYGGGYRLLSVQAVAVSAVVAYSMAMTLLLLVVSDRLLGNRANLRQETAGLDLSQHGEAAYSYTGGLSAAVAPRQNPDVGRHAEPEKIPVSAQKRVF
ncbi:MAG: ammonium transporter, Amt family [Micromonosporaceae bacterium]|nr:ammonium transporter, Amt family [Micromonosporaceae bacterium]